MFGFDFRIYWQAAEAILHGQTPYLIGGFFSPYPLALLLLPFALLPFVPAYSLWTLLNLLLLARAGDRWRFVKALLFFPVAFDLLQGQFDLLIFLLAMRLDWLGVALSTVRPQLAIWIIPFALWHWRNAKQYDHFWKSALAVVTLFGMSAVIHPAWWSEWLHVPSVFWQYNQQSASLFGLAAILPLPHIIVFVVIAALALICFILLRPSNARAFWQWVALFNPVANVYSLVVLFDQVDWVAIALGFVALPLSLVAHTNAVWGLIPLYLIAKDHFDKSVVRRSLLQQPAEPES